MQKENSSSIRKLTSHFFFLLAFLKIELNRFFANGECVNPWQYLTELITRSPRHALRALGPATPLHVFDDSRVTERTISGAASHSVPRSLPAAIRSAKRIGPIHEAGFIYETPRNPGDRGMERESG
ncbi:uncharacterized protein J3R85_008983 [Psidium guajava]|nr:uncharacterized protein J3R85_008983 [Psidium guajava]